MPLTLLCGPANSGKVRLVVDRFLDACHERRGAWLVVPTGGDIVRARNEVARREPMLAGARIGTFSHLLEELSGGVAGSDRAGAVEALLVRRAVESVPELAAMLEWPGFVGTASMRLRELRSAEPVGAGALAAALGDLPPSGRRAWRRALEAFHRELDGADLHDAATVEQQALTRIQAAAGDHVVPIHAYGFDDLTEVQRQVLVAASQHVDVVVSLPFVPGRLAFQRRQQLVDRMRAAGADVVVGGEAGFESSVLAAVEQRFLEPTADALHDAAGGDVTFVECAGDLQEAEEVVRAVGRLLRDGIAAEQIACIGAAPRRLRPLLEAALRRAGVPATFELSRSLGETPAGRALLDAIDAAIELDVTRFLAFARSRISGLDDDAVDDLDLRVRSTGIDEDDAGGARALPRWARSGVVPAAWRAVACLDPRRGDTGTVELVHELVEGLVAPSAGDLRLLAAASGLLAEIAAMRERPASLVEVRDALRAMPVPAPTDRPTGCVVVAPVTRVRTDRFDAVVVFGLHSGGFTGGASTADDDEAPLVARELAYVALTRPRRRLVLVRQSSHSDGRERAPHPVWLEVRRLLPGAPVVRRGLDAVAVSPSEVVFEREVAPAVALAAGSGVLPARQRSQEPFAGVLASASLPIPADDAGDGFRTWLADRGRIAVTDVEAYAACSARWMIDRRLLRDDPSADRSGQRAGMLAHAALKALADATPQGGVALPSTDADVRRALEVAVEAIGTPAPTVAEIEVTAFVLERMLAEDEVLGDRVLGEVAIGGDDGEVSPLELDGTVLVGRVDRVDMAADGAAVLHDYKLSRTATRYPDFVGTSRLQLALYWRALEHPATGLHPVGALYRPLLGDRPRGLLAPDAPPVGGEFRTDRVKAADEASEAIDGVVEEARRAIAAMRAGRVAAEPRSGECPSWCNLHPICRRPLR